MNIEEAAKAALLEEAVPGLFYVVNEGLERFAKIIRNQALEDAALLCDAYLSATHPKHVAHAIRAMKEQT